MATIYDVLAHIGGRMPRLEPIKAFKLAYYAQAWHATWEGSPLYPERTEAWTYGPVCRAGWEIVKYDEWSGAIRANPLTESESSVVDAVLDFYGRMDGWQLSRLAHEEDPWRDARGDLSDSEKSANEITVSSMRKYYTRKAMMGESGPARPALPSAPVPHDVAMEIAREQMERWREALELLADR
jgi:uncharacterized phage-associated protein